MHLRVLVSPPILECLSLKMASGRCHFILRDFVPWRLKDYENLCVKTKLQKVPSPIERGFQHTLSRLRNTQKDLNHLWNRKNLINEGA